MSRGVEYAPMQKELLRSNSSNDVVCQILVFESHSSALEVELRLLQVELVRLFAMFSYVVGKTKLQIVLDSPVTKNILHIVRTKNKSLDTGVCLEISKLLVFLLERYGTSAKVLSAFESLNAYAALASGALLVGEGGFRVEKDRFAALLCRLLFVGGKREDGKVTNPGAFKLILWVFAETKEDDVKDVMLKVAESVLVTCYPQLREVQPFHVLFQLFDSISLLHRQVILESLNNVSHSTDIPKSEIKALLDLLATKHPSTVLLIFRYLLGDLKGKRKKKKGSVQKGGALRHLELFRECGLMELLLEYLVEPSHLPCAPVLNASEEELVTCVSLLDVKEQGEEDQKEKVKYTISIYVLRVLKAFLSPDIAKKTLSSCVEKLFVLVSDPILRGPSLSVLVAMSSWEDFTGRVVSRMLEMLQFSGGTACLDAPVISLRIDVLESLGYIFSASSDSKEMFREYGGLVWIFSVLAGMGSGESEAPLDFLLCLLETMAHCITESPSNLAYFRSNLGQALLFDVINQSGLASSKHLAPLSLRLMQLMITGPWPYKCDAHRTFSETCNRCSECLVVVFPDIFCVIVKLVAKAMEEMFREKKDGIENVGMVKKKEEDERIVEKGKEEEEQIVERREEEQVVEKGKEEEEQSEKKELEFIGKEEDILVFVKIFKELRFIVENTPDAHLFSDVGTLGCVMSSFKSFGNSDVFLKHFFDDLSVIVVRLGRDHAAVSNVRSLFSYVLEENERSHRDSIGGHAFLNALTDMSSCKVRPRSSLFFPSKAVAFVDFQNVPASTFPPPKGFSVSFWVCLRKSRSKGDDNMQLFTFDPPASSKHHFYVSCSISEGMLTLWSTTSDSFVFDSFEFERGKWYHVVVSHKPPARHSLKGKNKEAKRAAEVDDGNSNLEKLEDENSNLFGVNCFLIVDGERVGGGSLFYGKQANSELCLRFGSQTLSSGSLQLGNVLFFRKVLSKRDASVILGSGPRFNGFVKGGNDEQDNSYETAWLSFFAQSRNLSVDNSSFMSQLDQQLLSPAKNLLGSTRGRKKKRKGSKIEEKKSEVGLWPTLSVGVSIKHHELFRDNLACVGGIGSVVFMLVNCKESKKAAEMLCLLGAFLKGRKNREEMVSLCGWEILATLLRVRKWTYSPEIVEALWKLVGLAGEVNLMALEKLLLDWRIWCRAPEEIQVSIFRRLSEALADTPEGNRNRKKLKKQEISLLSVCLGMFQDDSPPILSVVPYISQILERLLQGPLDLARVEILRNFLVSMHDDDLPKPKCAYHRADPHEDKLSRQKSSNTIFSPMRMPNKMQESNTSTKFLLANQSRALLEEHLFKFLISACDMDAMVVEEAFGDIFVLLTLLKNESESCRILTLSLMDLICREKNYELNEAETDWMAESLSMFRVNETILSALLAMLIGKPLSRVGGGSIDTVLLGWNGNTLHHKSMFVAIVRCASPCRCASDGLRASAVKVLGNLYTNFAKEMKAIDVSCEMLQYMFVPETEHQEYKEKMKQGQRMREKRRQNFLQVSSNSKQNNNNDNSKTDDDSSEIGAVVELTTMEMSILELVLRFIVDDFRGKLSQSVSMEFLVKHLDRLWMTESVSKGRVHAAQAFLIENVLDFLEQSCAEEPFFMEACVSVLECWKNSQMKSSKWTQHETRLTRKCLSVVERIEEKDFSKLMHRIGSCVLLGLYSGGISVTELLERRSAAMRLFLHAASFLIHCFMIKVTLEERWALLDLVAEEEELMRLLRWDKDMPAKVEKREEELAGYFPAVHELPMEPYLEIVVPKAQAKKSPLKKTSEGFLKLQLELNKPMMNRMFEMIKMDNMAARKWRDLERRLTHERSLWPGKVVKWKLDDVEDPMRCRRRLKGVREETEDPFAGLPVSLSPSQTIPSLKEGEKVEEVFQCALIHPYERRLGEVVLTTNRVFFVDDPSAISDKKESAWLKKRKRKNVEMKRRFGTVEAWTYEQVKDFHKRRYLLRDTAVEIFITTGQTFLFAFEKAENRNAVIRNISSKELPSRINYESSVVLKGNLWKLSITEKWQRGLISSFEYLQHLNTLAGRSYNDLTQYPVFPWVLSDYESDTIDLGDPSVYRNLAWAMGCQNEKRKKSFLEKFEILQQMGETPYHYGSHYSNVGVVLHFLLRLEPFSSFFLQFQGGHFDVADRLFDSVNTTWKLASERGTTDVKECIPEFYYLDTLFRNENKFDLGVKQNGERVDDVKLPPWAQDSPRLFVRTLRKALEGPIVSEMLPHWIDLIFGYQQQGEEAVKAVNVFFPLTYEGAVDIDEIKDPVEREAVRAQINSYGQIPKQLFHKPHPKRITHGVIPALIKACSKSLGECSLECTQLSHNGGKVGFVDVIQSSPVILGESEMLVYPDCSLYLSWQIQYPKVRMCSLRYGTPLRQMDCMEGITCAHMPGDGGVVVFGGSTQVLEVWKVAGSRSGIPQLEKTVSLHGHTGTIRSVFVSSKHSVCLSGSDDATCIVWDLTKLEYVRSITTGGRVDFVTLNEVAGEVLTVSREEHGGSVLNLWSINGRHLAKFESKNAVSCAVFSAAQQGICDNIVIAGTDKGSLIFLKAWNLQFLVEHNSKPAHPITSLALDEECSFLVSGSQDGAVKMWTTRSMAKEKKVLGI